MITFKDFFKKHLAFNLLALVLPISLFILGFFLVPQGYIDYSGFHPMNLFLALAILSICGLVLFTNGIFIAKSKTKKITAIIFVYISFIAYLIAFYFIELLIFHKKWGFIADITQENSSLAHKITDCLYTILAPSFVTVFVAVGVIIFTVYFIQSARKNKQQATDTTTA